MSGSISLSGKLQGFPRTGWGARALTVLLWSLAAMCAVFWGLRLGEARSVSPGAAPVLRAPDPPDPQAVARLLGASGAVTGASPAAASRLVLLGVVAGGAGAGAALIAVDGEAARPFRVGSRVQDDLWLQAVQAREARLGPTPQGPATLTLELPPLEDPGLLERP